MCAGFTLLASSLLVQVIDQVLLRWPAPACQLVARYATPCALCGGSRALHHLAGGRIPSALAANAFVPGSVLLATGLASVCLLSRRTRGRVSGALVWILGLGFLGYLIQWGRNLFSPP
jgi:hypothetical protein